MSLLLFISTAFLLGMRHALEPDHLVAVSTLVAEERRLWPAARHGLIWGLGHMVSISLVGFPVLLLRYQLPVTMENVVDLGVGLILVLLGARTISRWFRERAHLHDHNHDGKKHAHFHAHPTDLRKSHVHHGSVLRRQGLVTFGLGLVHGLAGSGAAAVLALTVAPSVISGVGYLLVFGIGTCLGMFSITLGVAAPALTTLSQSSAIHGLIRAGAGFSSLTIGILMWIEIIPKILD